MSHRDAKIITAAQGLAERRREPTPTGAHGWARLAADAQRPEDGAEVDDQTASDVEVREPRLFQVIMHNDHYTTMDFVVSVLESVFHKTPSEATQIMLAIHRRGRGQCGTYPREVAEMKIERVHQLAREHEFPLRCTMEEA